MEFRPVYFKEKINDIRLNGPENGKLNVINPEGHSALITLWSKISGNGGYWEKIDNSHPELLKSDSPLVLITNLYGNGLPQMLANIAYNPQIERIAVSGGNASKSAESLENFFKGKIAETKIGDSAMIVINETQFPLPKELHLDNFKYKPEIRRFNNSDLEEICKFVSLPRINNLHDLDRTLISLPSPVFRDFPSDRTNHNISAKNPLEAWMEVMYLIDRFGVNESLQGEKGMRRALFNLDVNIENAAFENEEDLKKFGYDLEELRTYRAIMIDPREQPDKNYTYGNRIRRYFGIDALKVCGERLKTNKMDRHALVSLWDTSKDLLHTGKDASAPCFTDAYFCLVNEKLMMTAQFRTHNAVSAWLTNVYGLRSIQETVSRYAEIEPGQLNIRSRWIGIDPDNAKTIKAQSLVRAYRKVPLEVNDQRGYFVTELRENKIVLSHYSPQGLLLREYSGTPKEIKDSLRFDRAVSDPDHTMWIGYNIAKAEVELHGKIKEI